MCKLVRRSPPKCGGNCPISGQRKEHRILSRLWLSWFFRFRSSRHVRCASLQFQLFVLQQCGALSTQCKNPDGKQFWLLKGGMFFHLQLRPYSRFRCSDTQSHYKQGKASVVNITATISSRTSSVSKSALKNIGKQRSSFASRKLVLGLLFSNYLRYFVYRKGSAWRYLQ